MVRPWSTMFWPWSIMVHDHGRPQNDHELTMVWPWSTTFVKWNDGHDHGRPWSNSHGRIMINDGQIWHIDHGQTMVDHGQPRTTWPSTDHEMTINLTLVKPWSTMVNPEQHDLDLTMVDHGQPGTTWPSTDHEMTINLTMVNPGHHDLQLTMKWPSIWPWSNHGRPWSTQNNTTLIWPWSTMVNPGQHDLPLTMKWPSIWPWSNQKTWPWTDHEMTINLTMVNPEQHDLELTMKWQFDHGQTMVDHGQPRTTWPSIWPWSTMVNLEQHDLELTMNDRHEFDHGRPWLNDHQFDHCQTMINPGQHALEIKLWILTIKSFKGYIRPWNKNWSGQGQTMVRPLVKFLATMAWINLFMGITNDIGQETDNYAKQGVVWLLCSFLWAFVPFNCKRSSITLLFGIKLISNEG